MRVSSVVSLVALCLFAAVGAADEPAVYTDDRFRSDATMPADERAFIELVVTRSISIDNALGKLFQDLETPIRIVMVSPRDDDYPRGKPASYDPARHVLAFRRSLLGSFGRTVPRWAGSYWPYYQSVEARLAYPQIEVIDAALWSAHLQEAAHQRGLTWPNEDCAALDMSRRLGCEMLFTGTSEWCPPYRPPMFNANRLDRIWPERLRDLQSHTAQRDDREYGDARRFGGILLLQQLVLEFGAPRVFTYAAQTPFRIEGDNVRLSALRYQERARDKLRVNVYAGPVRESDSTTNRGDSIIDANNE